MAPHSSTLAWKIPWMEEPGGLQSWGCKESDMTERLHFHFSLSCIGEWNGNPLQCSCLENPRDGGAWWAAVYGVTQSQTRLKRLSSSSSSITKMEKTLESPLNCKEIKPVNPKGNQPWIFIGRTDAEAPILWPPDVTSRLIGKDPDAGKDWGQEKKGVIEDEMVGWHHWLNGHEFEQTLRDSESQGSLACCSSWGCKESDTTEWLNNNHTEARWGNIYVPGHRVRSNQDFSPSCSSLAGIMPTPHSLPLQDGKDQPGVALGSTDICPPLSPVQSRKSGQPHHPYVPGGPAYPPPINSKKPEPRWAQLLRFIAEKPSPPKESLVKWVITQSTNVLDKPFCCSSFWHTLSNATGVFL